MAEGRSYLQFRLKNALEEKERISARVALVHPDAVCELQALAKTHGYNDTKLAWCLSMWPKHQLNTRGRLTPAAPQGQGSAAQEGRPDP